MKTGVYHKSNVGEYLDHWTGEILWTTLKGKKRIVIESATDATELTTVTKYKYENDNYRLNVHSEGDRITLIKK